MRELLWRKWDPLGLRGMAPDDEYDAQARVLGSKLKRGNSRDDIASYLATTLNDEACVSDAWRKRCDLTAQELSDWYAKSNAPVPLTMESRDLAPSGSAPDPPFPRRLPDDTLVARDLFHAGFVGGTSELTILRDGRASILSWPGADRREVLLPESTLRRIRDALAGVDFPSLHSAGAHEDMLNSPITDLAAEGRSLRYVAFLVPAPMSLDPLLGLLRGVEKEYGS